MSKEQENKIEIMMVQLLFNKKPQTPSADQLKSALEKYLDTPEEVPYIEPSEKTTGEMFMFPLPKYKAVMKDKPEGVPVMAVFMGSDTESGIEADEMKRSQFWDVQDGGNIIDECRYTILLNTIFGAALSYQEQAEIILAQVGAALDCYPECTGIYVQQSGKLTTPEMFEENKEYSLSQRFINLFVNARFFNVPETDEMVIDTLGFNVFGGADVQVHFKDMDPNYVVNYVYNVASYQFDNDFPVKSGETIDSIDENGDMQMEPQWSVQYEESLVDPLRTVLDINCGEYAGGNR